MSNSARAPSVHAMGGCLVNGQVIPRMGNICTAALKQAVNLSAQTHTDASWLSNYNNNNNNTKKKSNLFG